MIGELIRINLLESAPGDMIQNPSVKDVGFVAFSLSRKWLAESIHKMLKDGIDTWAPKLPVGRRVVVNYPTLDEKIHMGWFRRSAIATTLIRMLQYSKVDVQHFMPTHSWVDSQVPELITNTILGRQFSIRERDRDVVIHVGEKPPFILARGDFEGSYDLKKLWLEIHDFKADWIVYVTPVRQQEYIEMCFTAAKLEGWINTDAEGEWNPSNGYPLLTYAGYRAYSTEQEELPNLLQQVKDRCDLVAQSVDAQSLGYTAEAILSCVFMYTCLKNHRLADCTFNFDEMVKEEGNTFLYLLHRRAEVHRITKEFCEDIHKLKEASYLNIPQSEECEEVEERMLEFHLLKFTEVLEESCLFVLAHVMCEYLYDLSEKFKSYHNNFAHGIRSMEKTRRLLLCEATAVVMEKCFYLLGITPEVAVNCSPDIRRVLRKSGLRHRFTNLPEEVASIGGPNIEGNIQELAQILQSSLNLTMDEYAPMAVEVGVEPEFRKYLITPCFVSDARDPSRNSRFELISIIPFIKTDPLFEKGELFGLISVSDKYGIRSDGGYPLYEPDFPYVSLFEHEWSDPVNMRHSWPVYLDNPSSRLSVPFASSIDVRMELYAKKKRISVINFAMMCLNWT